METGKMYFEIPDDNLPLVLDDNPGKKIIIIFRINN